MRQTKRKLAFVLAASDHGSMIVNRFDYRMQGPNTGIGVGFQLLERSAFDPEEIDVTLNMLELRRKYFGTGVFAIDCGANIGVHTIEWAKFMTGWGSVLAIEAQERLFYALAGNIAINNCFNARALNAAVGANNGTMKIPRPNYLTPGSFGSLELRKTAQTEAIGQTIDYSEEKLVPVRLMMLDSIEAKRCDLIKIDVEGMELDVMEGAAQTIDRHHPALLVETIKGGRDKILTWLAQRGYKTFPLGINYLAFHESDPCLKHVSERPPKLAKTPTPVTP